ncbi:MULTISPECIES: GNAT family N-acetyltransferase [unclassified Streptomyces]|uniref:GNAT family N-acetyltransferase n=1 Tax=Streptomyces TaxID=1883 RepID=UPI0001C18F52|nr:MULTISPECIES: GNAT family N-acetyltransferase [unclassified Streptomyces]AEN08552.1 GCN5-related N-acetyltransferase [Streptomyces sp. SirexAA-E]MYR69483.1 GNAT family N-acetyltransferase [Streptomyces sp. SID4939]MYT66302.1 GNAT family N-acetyltransferase [Streptomyces sp. SID8357]MYT83222.1 GNAT family N-acetyltransferase [Streptomyces sp. SID8360]MYU33937.1 GNAT family N-acetyltransferase [Streptomyces sp. SID8358]
MTEIVPVTGPELVTYADELAALLVETVEGGSSVGFLAPLDREAAADWWRRRAALVESGDHQVWIARDDERVVGTVGLVRAPLPNARHRAEVAKLMVRPSARGLGVGRALLTAVERSAAADGLSLLVLDTETGSLAEELYRSAGWTECGSIPAYAGDPSGALKATTFYYRVIGPSTGTARQWTGTSHDRGEHA